MLDLEYGLPVQVQLLYYHVGSRVRSPCTGSVTILSCWIKSTVSVEVHLPDYQVGSRVRSPCAGTQTIILDIEYVLPVQVELLYYPAGRCHTAHFI